MTRSVVMLALLVAFPAATCRSPASPAAQILTLEVAPNTVTCTGEVERQCLLVRENPTAEWTRFYDTISGFTYQEGYRYRIRVERRRVENPPADGSAYTYRLVELLDKEPVP